MYNIHLRLIRVNLPHSLYLQYEYSPYNPIYIIIAVGPLYVCLSVCMSVNSSETAGRIYFIFGGKDRYYIWLGSYLYFMTLGQRSRSPEVIEIIYLFDSL